MTDNKPIPSERLFHHVSIASALEREPFDILDSHHARLAKLEAAVFADDRCHRCGHFEISHERASATYAHCPSCGRHTTWERVPAAPAEPSEGDAVEMLREMRWHITGISACFPWAHHIDPVIAAIEAERAAFGRTLKALSDTESALAAEKRAHGETREAWQNARELVLRREAECRAVEAKLAETEPKLRAQSSDGLREAVDGLCKRWAVAFSTGVKGDHATFYYECSSELRSLLAAHPASEPAERGGEKCMQCGGKLAGFDDCYKCDTEELRSQLAAEVKRREAAEEHAVTANRIWEERSRNGIAALQARIDKAVSQLRGNIANQNHADGSIRERARFVSEATMLAAIASLTSPSAETEAGDASE